MEDGAMAYWYNLCWPVRGTSGDAPGVIERIEDLSTDYILKKATLAKKKKATVQRDIYGKKVKNNGKVVKKKEQYVKAKLEKQEITFRTTYHVATGTLDIAGKIEEIKGMIGSSGPLVLGRTAPHVFGMFEMRLTNVGVSGIELDDIGRILKADITFTLRQVNKKKFKKQSAQFPGESAKTVLRFWCENPKELPKQYESAVKISPDKNVKKLWKKRKKK